MYNEVLDLIVPDGSNHLILVTKILLGVFANIPAYDNYFCKTFRTISEQSGISRCRFRTVNEESLLFIQQFYQDNHGVIDKLQQSRRVYGFDGQPTPLHYSKAKLIDMYGFEKGFTL